MDRSKRVMMALAAVLVIAAVGLMVVPNDSEAADIPSVSDVTYGVEGGVSVLTVIFNDSLTPGSYTTSVMRDGVSVYSVTVPINTDKYRFLEAECDLDDGYYKILVKSNSYPVTQLETDILIGSATLTVKSGDESITELGISVGEVKPLTWETSPAGMTESVTWAVVSGEGHIELSADGKVTGRSAGIAVIQASFECARQTFTAQVIVKVGDVTTPKYDVTIPGEITAKNSSGNTVTSGNMDMGTKLTLSVSSEDGYDKTIYAVTGSGRTIVSGTYLVTENVTFGVVKVPKEYTIVYKPGSHGAFTMMSMPGYFGEQTPVPSKVVGEDGYVFIGWSPSVSATVTGDAEYVALWDEITGMSISSQKTEFECGEAFSTGGLVVTASYSYGPTADVTSSATVDSSAYKAGVPGTYTITVSYGGFSETYDVTVKDPVLTGISIDGQKAEFECGEEFSVGGLVVTASYSYGPTADVTSSATVDSSAYKAGVPGTYTITVSYGGFEKEYEVTVNHGCLVTFGPDIQVFNGQTPLATGSEVPIDSLLTVYVVEKTGFSSEVFVNDVKLVGSEITASVDLVITVKYSPTNIKAFIERNDDGSVTTSIIGLDGSVSTGTVQVSYIYGYMEGEIYRTGSVTMASQSVENDDSLDIVTIDTAITEERKVQSVWSVFTPSNGTAPVETPHIVYNPGCIVTFVTDEGSDVDVQVVAYGSTVSEPVEPTKEGSTFLGWFTASDGGVQWNFQDKVHRTMTLYAHWSVVQ